MSSLSASSVDLNIVNPPSLYDPAPHGYSHAVVVEHVHRIAYIAGQGGSDLGGWLSPGFADQVKHAYANLRAALDSVGATPRQVTKINTYVVDYEMPKLDIMTQYVQEMFGEALPAQTLVPVPRLALDGMLFEVDAIVALG